MIWRSTVSADWKLPETQNTATAWLPRNIGKYFKTGITSNGGNSFVIGNSRYVGKQRGKNRGIYVICDLPPRPTFTERDILHVEFVLVGRSSIKGKLGIGTIYDLEKSEDYFRLLADKYLVKAQNNQRKLQKHFHGVCIESVGDVVALIAKEKELITDRIRKHYRLNYMCGKRLRKKFKLSLINHLPSLYKTVDGVKICIELHRGVYPNCPPWYPEVDFEKLLATAKPIKIPFNG